MLSASEVPLIRSVRYAEQGEIKHMQRGDGGGGLAYFTVRWNHILNIKKDLCKTAVGLGIYVYIYIFFHIVMQCSIWEGGVGQNRTY